jgi:hypothetical protein
LIPSKEVKEREKIFREVKELFRKKASLIWGNR